MNWTRREFFQAALALPARGWLANYRPLAAAYQDVKITPIRLCNWTTSATAV
jgi:hypothetical protein